MNGMRYAGLATQWMVMLGLAVFLGLKLDSFLKTTPIFVVLLPVVALTGSLIQLIKELNKKK